MPPNVWGQRETMAQIHYNHYLGELRNPWSRGSTWNKYIIISYTKSYLRMLCSIYWNTSSFTNVWLHHIIRVQNHVYYKGGSKPQYTIMMSFERSGSCVHRYNIILCNLVHRRGNKVFINNPKELVQSKPCE